MPYSVLLLGGSGAVPVVGRSSDTLHSPSQARHLSLRPYVLHSDEFGTSPPLRARATARTSRWPRMRGTSRDKFHPNECVRCSDIHLYPWCGIVGRPYRRSVGVGRCGPSLKPSATTRTQAPGGGSTPGARWIAGDEKVKRNDVRMTKKQEHEAEGTMYMMSQHTKTKTAVVPTQLPTGTGTTVLTYPVLPSTVPVGDVPNSYLYYPYCTCTTVPCDRNCMQHGMRVRRRGR